MRYRYLRHPKTTQELRANQDRNDPYVRGRRRNLPTCRDDIMIRPEKSWKDRRNHQYREDGDKKFEWHEYEYDYWDVERRLVARQLWDFLYTNKYAYEYTRHGIKWYGPEFFWEKA